MCTFIPSPASHSLRERRLLRRGKAEAQHALGSPEIQGAANKAAAIEAMKQARIEQAQQGVRGAIDAVAPETNEEPVPETKAWKPFEKPWKPVSGIRPPTLKEAGGAATTLFIAANPIGHGIIAAGAVGGWKIWKKARNYPPFSWVDRGARGAVSASVNTVKFFAKIPTYLAMLTGRLSANGLRTGINAGYATLNATIFKLYRDAKEGLNAKLGIKKETGPAGTFTAGMKHLGGQLMSVPGMIIHHPVGAAAVGLGLYTLFTNPSGFVAGGKTVWGFIVKILEGLATKAGTPIPIPH